MTHPSFLRRRLARDDPFGLTLTLGLCVSLLGLTVFGWLTIQVVHQAPLTDIDREVAQALRQHAEEHPTLRDVFRVLTHAGGVPAMTVLAVGGGLVLLLRKQYVLAAGWVIAAAGGGLVDLALKTSIGRDRPPKEWRDPTIFEENESFPSGHAMGSVVGYATFGYVCMLVLRRRWARLALVALLAPLVLGIGFSRVYLRAHWLSDVLAGFAIGVAWVGLCITVMEVLRRRGDSAGRPFHPPDATL
ncbi:MAG: phosphatase PAP2 family protein [Gemmataceae bacterium]|nr:phosphatase PAP2 family protein [Gemmataceae bacterium]